MSSCARAGARAADVLREPVPWLTAAVGVVLLVGTNDVLHRTPLPAVRKQTASLLDALVTAGTARDHVQRAGSSVLLSCASPATR